MRATLRSSTVSTPFSERTRRPPGWVRAEGEKLSDIDKLKRGIAFSPAA
jgi:hypothetical protein